MSKGRKRQYAGPPRPRIYCYYVAAFLGDDAVGLFTVTRFTNKLKVAESAFGQSLKKHDLSIANLTNIETQLIAKS